MILIKRLINLMPPFWLHGFHGAGESGGNGEPQMTADFTAEAGLNGSSSAASRLNTILLSEPDGI